MLNAKKLLGVIAAATLVAVGAAVLFPQYVQGAPQVPPSAPVTIVNTVANPVPVAGTMKVAGEVLAQQSGTWSVEVSNFPEPSEVTPIRGGGQSDFMASGASHSYGLKTVASGISIQFSNGARDVIFRNGGQIVARFPGPSTVNLALSRPLEFDAIECGGSGGVCDVGWIGNLP